MNNRFRRLLGAILAIVMAGFLTSCEPPQVYGSVGYSTYGGGGYYGGYGTSIRVGGRIY